VQYINYEKKRQNTRVNKWNINSVIPPVRFKIKTGRCLKSVQAVCDEVGIADLASYLEHVRSRGDCILSRVGREYLYVQCAAITVKVDLWEGYVSEAWPEKRIDKRKKKEVS